MDAYTDRQFWENYWSDVDPRVEIGPKYQFHKLFRRFTEQQTIRNAIEIGGFPGYFSIFLAKHFGIEPTLLDFYIDRDTVRQLSETNQIPVDSVTLIEEDFLQFESDRKYDLVFSCGLIEHFENFDELIQRHVELLAPGGRLFIEIPNFRGLNGLIQKLWDPQNLAKHNLQSMEPTRLRTAVEPLPLNEIQVGYYGRYGTWLERFDELSMGVQSLYTSINFVGRKLSQLIPIETKMLSPYIIISGRSTATNADASTIRRAA